MATNSLRVGILSRSEYRKRTIAIARGEYIPKKDEPKLWFESLQSMAQVLSNDNQELLRVILEKKPASLKELENVTGRQSSNLSRTLKMMARYGIVELEKEQKAIRPIVKATSFKVEFGIAKISKPEAVDAITESITGALKKGDKVSMVGFATFDVAKRAAKEGVNPQTRRKIKIKASKAPRFKAGKTLKDAVNK
jgi:predicted transcriptional regulator